MVIGAVFAVLLLTSMYATELVRLSVSRTITPPVALPRGIDVRESDQLVALIGKGTPDGKAAAITLGYVIVVPADFTRMSTADQRRVIEHELVHVQQRDRYWRFYLPLYGALYLLRGYQDHPFERQANRQE